MTITLIILALSAVFFAMGKVRSDLVALISGRVKGVEGVFRMLTSGIESAAPLFVIYVFATQLICSILYLV